MGVFDFLTNLFGGKKHDNSDIERMQASEDIKEDFEQAEQDNNSDDSADSSFDSGDSGSDD